MDTLFQEGARGAAAGAIGTVPMSAVMLIGQRLGWMNDQPPKALTEEGLRLAGVRDEVSEGAIDALAVASHLGFGAASGALFDLLQRAIPEASPLPLGIAFGLGVWAASYRGWIPAMGSLPLEQRRGGRGTAVMIAAHAVYGATIGALAGRNDRA